MKDIDPHRQYVDTNVVILPTDPDYLEQVIDAYAIGYNVPHEFLNHPEALNIAKLREHLRVFPEGQFMAYDVTAERVVGMCSGMIVDFDESQPLMETWRETTADGTLSTHNPRGEWMYGVDNVVLPEYRGKGVGGRLMRARFNVARKYNLRGMIAGSMPIDYRKAAADGVTIEDYVADVVAGRRWDTNLSKQIKKGFRVHNIIPNYLEDSPSTLNYAVAILRDNPGYRLPKTLPRKTATAPVIRPSRRA